MTDTAHSNSRARGDTLKSSLERLYQADREIAALIESSGIAELRAEKSDIFKVLRDDFQMPSALVRARYTAFRFERAAEDGQDDITADAIREMFELVPIGGMVDMMDALQKTAPVESAYDLGYKAQGQGSSLNENPFDGTDIRQQRWHEGWEASLEAIGASMAAPAGKPKRAKKAPQDAEAAE